MKIIDCTILDSVVVMFDVRGFGKPFDAVLMLLKHGVVSLTWGAIIR